MPEFETGSWAVGMIFPYQNPVSENRLTQWLEDNDFEIIEADSQQTLTITPQGPQVEGEEGFAKKDDVRILFNASANLNGFSNSSFITAKNSDYVEPSGVLEVTEEIYDWLESDVGAASDIETIELTIQGLIRVDGNHDMSRYYSDDSLELLETVGGYSGDGVTVRFESNAEADTSDWYQFLLDEKAVGNPKLWGMKLVTRYGGLQELVPDQVFDSLDQFIEFSVED